MKKKMAKMKKENIEAISSVRKWRAAARGAAR
jgi:hypothetical protein